MGTIKAHHGKKTLTTRMTFMVDEDLDEAARAAAREAGVPMSVWCRRAIAAAVERAQDERA